MDIEDLRDLWEADLELAGWEAGPIPIITSSPEKTSIWSDLHFADRSALEAFGRPFADVARMNHHLVREWQYRVRAGDTIICLGDIGHPDACSGGRRNGATLRHRGRPRSGRSRGAILAPR